MVLNERNKQVLYAVVQSYINSAGPVGSRYVTKKYAFGLSPATIRNIMADLEEMGFLRQPHTSAGRVPTDIGYRYYVDQLTTERKSSGSEQIADLHIKLEHLRKDINSFLDETSRMLSSLSHYIGVTMSPRDTVTTLAKIELIKYKDSRVAILLFTDEGIIRNSVVSLDHPVSQKDLSRIAEYINSKFTGISLNEIRKKILREMTEERVMCDRLIDDAMSICQSVFSSPAEDVYISGLSEVVCLPDFCDIQKIRELLSTLDDKKLIVKILDSIGDAEGTHIIIGSENPVDEMKDFSVIVSMYGDNRKPLGMVGIIGPKRMDYDKAISIVETTADFISSILTER